MGDAPKSTVLLPPPSIMAPTTFTLATPLRPSRSEKEKKEKEKETAVTVATPVGPSPPRDKWAEYMLDPETECPYTLPWRLSWFVNRSSVRRDVELYRMWHDLRDTIRSYDFAQRTLYATRSDREGWEATQRDIAARAAEAAKKLVAAHGPDVTEETVLQDSEIQMIAMEFDTADAQVQSMVRQEKKYVVTMSKLSHLRLVLQDRLSNIGPYFDTIRVLNEVSERVQLDSTAMQTLEEKLEKVEMQSTALGMVHEQMRDSDETWSRTMGASATTSASLSHSKFAAIIREALRAAQPEQAQMQPQTQTQTQKQKRSVAATVTETLRETPRVPVAKVQPPQQTPQLLELLQPET